MKLKYFVLFLVAGCALETAPEPLEGDDNDAGDVAVTSQALLLAGYTLPLKCRTNLHWQGNYEPFIYDSSSDGSTPKALFFSSWYGTKNQIQTGAFWSFGKAGLYMAPDSPYCLLVQVRMDFYCHNDINNSFARNVVVTRPRAWYAPWDGFEFTADNANYCGSGLHIERSRTTAYITATTTVL